MYKYENHKNFVYTDYGIEVLVKIIDKARNLHKTQPYVTMDELISGICGTNWDTMAVVDYLIEKGYFYKTHHGPYVYKWSGR